MTWPVQRNAWKLMNRTLLPLIDCTLLPLIDESAPSGRQGPLRASQWGCSSSARW